MGKVYLGNAFSLAMLSDLPATVRVEEVKATTIPTDAESIISHESTAQVVSRLLGREIPFNRVNVSLSKGDTLYVFQVLKRPAEGQIFTTKELEEIISSKLYKILKVSIV